MEHIEYEERVLIKYDDYQKIIEDIKKSDIPYTSFIINNIYLDNRDHFIRKNKYMLRIRTTSHGVNELTLKMNNPDGSCREINETLREHPTIDKELSGSFNEYYEIVKLITNRIEIKREDYLFVIDRNQYLDVVDYDIEIEASSQEKAKEIILEYCNKYNLIYKPNYKNKSTRAFKRLKKMKKSN